MLAQRLTWIGEVDEDSLRKNVPVFARSFWAQVYLNISRYALMPREWRL